MRLALSTDEELDTYYHDICGYKEVLVTEAYTRCGSSMGKTYRAVYVKDEPKKFELPNKLNS